ncbi:FAD:protein FMN transferase [Candidatus Woesearchaeota archaeon]|nr:FAD:protein FMN transferase [Candidatus Woesearchaeota archaeon]
MRGYLNSGSLKPVFLASIFFLLLLAGCSSSKKTELKKEMMGTEVSITVYHEDRGEAEKAIGMAFDEIARIESAMSAYINSSEVYMLNRDGKIEGASDELTYVIGRSLRYGDISKGSFDITVQPILDLYKHTFEELGRPPTEGEVRESLDFVGYEGIFIRNRDIEFTRPGMKITLGGIAKGYIIDKAAASLEKNGIENALINAGGDIRASGSKMGEEWNIALQNPRKKQDYITIIPLNNMSVATSGDYERFFDDSGDFHHIIDPRTGYSADELMSVTVIAEKAMDADALSTSAFVLGKEEGLNLIESIDGAECLMITRDKKILRSSGFVW